jgi:chemotaxis protein CheD
MDSGSWQRAAMTSVADGAGTRPPREDSRTRVYLHAGQVFASREPCEISTVLGSCVGVVLVDALLRTGGACHYLLPFDAADGLATPRFGNPAIGDLIARMLAMDSRKRDLEAKLFGGASMLSQARPNVPSLGTKNVDVARRRLADEGIPIVAEDVGGYAGRKLVFLTDEGHVWVKKL